MHELLVRTVSGVVFVALLLGCILASPFAFAALGLIVLSIGTFEMFRLFKFKAKGHLVCGCVFALSSYIIAGMVALNLLPMHWLLLEIPIFMLPLLEALFSKSDDITSVLTYSYVSLIFLALPLALMLFMYREDLFGTMSGSMLLILVFVTLWVNDIFAYLTGKLLGKHKLFPRISPGKTIEGSLGGLIFTVISVMIFSHYIEWMSPWFAIGFALIVVVFGTLGDLCESMLKRHADAKDSGKLIPGHGGVLDRFDSVMFSVPFIFVYLLLL